MSIQRSLNFEEFIAVLEGIDISSFITDPWVPTVFRTGSAHVSLASNALMLGIDIDDKWSYYISYWPSVNRMYLSLNHADDELVTQEERTFHMLVLDTEEEHFQYSLLHSMNYPFSVVNAIREFFENFEKEKGARNE